MISVREHAARLLGAVGVLDPVSTPLLQAQGCVLAGDVESLVSLPGFDNSAMDGYAVRAAEVAGASEATPVVLPVVGDIAAGDTRHLTLQPGETMRIMTGAPMPAGADAVVPVEQSDGGTRDVAIREGVDVGRHVRRCGEDVRAGDVVLVRGTRLGARELALSAAVGRGELPVHPRPRVVVVSTGDELVPAGAVPGFGEVVDSNSLMLVTALREHGVDADLVSGVPDDEQTLLDTLADAAARADAVVTTGGVSMGAFDVVKSALGTLGTVEFTKVAMQPGKPQGFGTIGPRSTPVFTLPGNPVSALVSLEVFVVPALRRMAGRDPREVPLVDAVVEAGWSSPPGRTQFARAILTRTDTASTGDGSGGTEGADAEHANAGRVDTGYTVRGAGGQGSHMLASLAQANALAIVPAETTRVVAGDRLRCLPLGPVRLESPTSPTEFWPS